VSVNRKLLLTPVLLAAVVAMACVGWAMAQEGGRGRGGRGGGRGPGGLGDKAPDFPANLFVSASTVAHTSLRHEWVEIPAGKTKLHTWIEYPAGEAKAPVVIVMHYEAGLDVTQQALADQLALQGFIAVAPDLLSGRGPNGGNFEAFLFPDEALRATLRVPQSEALRLYKAAYEYAMKLPRGNGKIASLGGSIGGTLSFRFAAEVPSLSAAVVFYGLPPAEATLAKINAPVLALYGGDDERLVATIDPTAAAMKKLGKSFESHVYPGATHGFMTYQVEGLNREAITEAWPAAVAFLRDHTK
jgi:carboxymethylenebutenolidase